MKKYKILSLDGGGSWSIIQVKTLQNLYGADTPGHEVLQKFNLAVANSGGSLVLACLCLNLKLSEISDILTSEEKRRRVFVELPLRKKIVRLFGLGPKYYAHKKREGLLGILNESEIEMEDIPARINPGNPDSTHILIAAFDYDRERVFFYRSNHNSLASTRPGNKRGYSLLDAIHSASNAPVNYFNGPALVNRNQKIERFWDGAVAGFNNPALAGITEALANKVEAKDIQILSIGTGNVFLPLEADFQNEARKHPSLFKNTEKSSTLRDLPKMASSILSDPPDSASYMTHTILATAQKDVAFIRMNPLISPVFENEKWEYPTGFRTPEGRRQFDILTELDMDAVKEKDFKLVVELCEKWLNNGAPNQSIRHDKHFNPLPGMGHKYYSEAKTAWEKLAQSAYA